ncbi:MAG: VWA domain-containing protein [Chitinophagaceae bacterium]|nr:VWA domain-containing protein [Chitinophagaceae bacterium]
MKSSSNKKQGYRRSALFCFLLLAISCSAFSQESALYRAKTNRILFVLDASGSMKGSLKNTSSNTPTQTKFVLSKQMLIHTIDSISKANPNVEFAVRVFGHQSPRSANNCKDTRLEIPFGKNNGAAVAKRLEEIKAQGQTPIEYTLMQSISDFPTDSLSNNSIVLITDGNETCNGNICSVASQMAEKGIVLKPFIIGLGLSDSIKKKFECAGAFYDVQQDDMFAGIMNVVISRALNATTAQINLLDAFGIPSETNVELSLYDHLSGKVKYNFVHTLNAKGNPDTLILDPEVHYDLLVHSIPPVIKKDIELVKGIHNTIAADVPQGTLELKWETTSPTNPSAPCLVREAGKTELMAVQDINRLQKYLVGKYDLEILTLPRIIMHDVQLDEAKTTSIKIPRTGTLSVSPSAAGVASVLVKQEKNLQKVWDFTKLSSTKTIALQPGSYVVIFRPDKGKQSAKTKEYPVQISSGKTTMVKL